MPIDHHEQPQQSGNDALPKPEGLFDRLIQFSIQNAIWIILFVVAWIGVGVWSYQK